MNAKKLIAMALCLMMLLSMAACVQSDPTQPDPSTNAPTQGQTTPPTNAPTEPAEPKAPASIDFKDGNMAFVQMYSGKANADASTLEVVDYNGDKALKVINGSGKVPYVAFDISSLLGDNAGKVASIEIIMGLEHPDGKFFAASGTIVTWTGADLAERTHAWSIYMEKKNPKSCVAQLDTAGGEVFTGDKNIMMITLLDDNGLDKGAKNANLLIDDIRFLDAEGNLIEADTSATFNGPDAFNAEKDMSNLFYIKDETVLLDTAISGAGWGQTDTGKNVPDFASLFVPGAVVEIEYSSESGDIWLVFPDSGAGWQRIEQQTARTNNSKNIAQITYEEIAAILGEDVSTWGGRIQCEASANWEVYSIKIGMNSGLVHTGNNTLLDGSAISGAGWAQTDVGSAAEQWLPLMVPGAVIEIEYTSEDGSMWIVLPDAANGWTRLDTVARCNGSICQITYEDIASILGEDTSTWGGRIQCEAMANWEVYTVSICQPMANTKGNTLLDGSPISGAGWAQVDVGSAADQWLPLMVPGAVITIQYESADGTMWIVLPDAANGWTRLDTAACCDGSICQISYEDIASILGEDTSTWGGRIQCEAKADWTVYAIYIGTAA